MLLSCDVVMVSHLSPNSFSHGRFFFFARGVRARRQLLFVLLQHKVLELRKEYARKLKVSYLADANGFAHRAAKKRFSCYRGNKSGKTRVNIQHSREFP